MKLNTSIVFLLILIFHVLVGGFFIYDYFKDFDGWSIYCWRPLLYIPFAVAWFGVYRQKNYIWGFVYIGLVMAEFLFFAIFRGEIWAETFGRVLFPIDLIFTAVLLLLFKKHFGILSRSDKQPSRTETNA